VRGWQGCCAAGARVGQNRRVRVLQEGRRSTGEKGGGWKWKLAGCDTARTKSPPPPPHLPPSSGTLALVSPSLPPLRRDRNATPSAAPPPRSDPGACDSVLPPPPLPAPVATLPCVTTVMMASVRVPPTKAAGGSRTVSSSGGNSPTSAAPDAMSCATSVRILALAAAAVGRAVAVGCHMDRSRSNSCARCSGEMRVTGDPAGNPATSDDVGGRHPNRRRLQWSTYACATSARSPMRNS